MKPRSKKNRYPWKIPEEVKAVKFYAEDREGYRYYSDPEFY